MVRRGTVLAARELRWKGCFQRLGRFIRCRCQIVWGTMRNGLS